MIYQWQGKKVNVKFGVCIPEINTEKPLMWYNYELTALSSGRIYAIEITYYDEIFVISNHYGIGEHKLLCGGWPNKPHFSLDGEFYNTGQRPIIDLEGYEEHERYRKRWQRRTYPKQMKKIDSLINNLKNNGGIKKH